MAILVISDIGKTQSLRQWVGVERDPCPESTEVRP